jgi:hypothetical protein
MIAISYRRDDSLPIAGRLYDRLQATYGKTKVFMDFDSIRPGLDFRSQIKETISQSEVVIALIGSKWVGAESDSNRRIDDPNDFVRLEIAHALERDIPIIPVLVNNSPLPKPESLPDDIRALVYRHALPLDTGLDFHQHADRVIASVNSLLQPNGTAAPNDQKTPAGMSTSRPGRKRQILLPLITATLLAVVGAVIWLEWAHKSAHRTAAQPESAAVRRASSVVAAAPPQSPVASPSAAKFTPTAAFYTGVVRVMGDAESAPVRSIAVMFSPDLKSGAMTQSSKRGNFIVRFKGIWDGTELHGVTGETVARPLGIPWTPESFSLKFSPDGQRATYQCLSDGKSYQAELAPQSEFFANIAPLYRGKVSPGDTPVAITIGANRKSGLLNETTKSGDTVVTFTGIWDGDTMHAVTGEVVSKPENVRWKPESFTLRAVDGGRHLAYTCNDEGKILTAELSPP